LWVDGKLIATQKISQRVNMRKFWDSLPHPDNPKNLGGWSWGSEVMTSLDFYFTQYEDYKGLLDKLRFWDRAKAEDELKQNWSKAVAGNEKAWSGIFRWTKARAKFCGTILINLASSLCIKQKKNRGQPKTRRSKRLRIKIERLNNRCS
jgi:hypothetical protein